MCKSSDYYRELLQVSYENDRTVQAIVRFSGIAEFFRHFISDRVKEIRVDRSKTFFNELKKGNIEITEEVIRSEDFLHKFHLSYKAAINTRRRNKIRMFGRLLKSSLTNKMTKDIDVFEDYSKILDDLSYREIKTLVLFNSFYETPRDPKETDLTWTEKFWEDFERQLVASINIPKDSIGSFMTRLSRTGCYELFKGTYGSVDTSKGMGTLTPTFQHLRTFILDKTL